MQQISGVVDQMQTNYLRAVVKSEDRKDKIKKLKAKIRRKNADLANLRKEKEQQQEEIHLSPIFHLSL